MLYGIVENGEIVETFVDIRAKYPLYRPWNGLPEGIVEIQLTNPPDHEWSQVVNPNGYVLKDGIWHQDWIVKEITDEYALYKIKAQSIPNNEWISTSEYIADPEGTLAAIRNGTAKGMVK
jgi:hypothetical protein